MIKTGGVPERVRDGEGACRVLVLLFKKSGEGDSRAIRHAEPSHERCAMVALRRLFHVNNLNRRPPGKTPTGPGGTGLKDDHDRQAKTDSESKLPTKSTGREDRGELRRIFLKRQISCHENRSWLGVEQLPHMPHMIVPRIGSRITQCPGFPDDPQKSDLLKKRIHIFLGERMPLSYRRP